MTVNYSIFAPAAKYTRTVLLCAALASGLGFSAQGQTQAVIQSNPTSTTNTAALTLISKKIRIGVLRPGVQFGQSGSSVAEQEGVRSLIVKYLMGPEFEVVSIASVLPPQANEEAKQKQCDYVLVSSLTEKSKSGGLGMLRKAMPMASMIPGVGAVAGIGSAIAVANAANRIAAAEQLSIVVKAKSEMALDYQLFAPDNERPIFAETLEEKAKSDGEDIITPLITQADQAIVATFTKKK